MKLSLEILDHIFSFTVSDRETLIACSKDSALSSLVEKHVYYHVIVHIGNEETDFVGAFEPNHLSKLVSENPRIRYHVRILQIRTDFNNHRQLHTFIKSLDEFATTMLKFPSLECIMLSTSKLKLWHWSDAFRSALEDRLNLPTLKELHVAGSKAFPIALLDKCKGIEKLLLSGIFVGEGGASGSTLPQLKSLTLCTKLFSDSIWGWVKSHTKELQSLGCMPLTMEWLPELLEVCSGTLRRLEIDLMKTLYINKKDFRTGEILTNSFSESPTVHLDLPQLTIYTGVVLDHYEDHMPKTCLSWLAGAADVIKFFISSTRHLVLDVDIRLSGPFSSLANVDFLPLAILGAASRSIPRIDVYVHTDILPSALTRASFFSSLADCEDVMRSIEEGAVVIHWEDSLPESDLV